MRFFFILIITTFIFADIFDIYRYEGIEKIKNILEKQLQDKNFWLKRLKNIDVKYGYFEKPTFILFCNKKSKILNVFIFKHKKINHIITFNKIIVGKLGDKFKEGDLKTPIGNYKLIDKIIPKNSFYGPIAFVTNYPNLLDKVKGKNGHGIWIHGKPIDGERGDISKGCIVLNNNEIKYLSKIIDYKNTILEITQKPFYATKQDIAKILSLIYKWRNAWKKSDLNKYIYFYDINFKNLKGMNLEEFKKYKQKIFSIRKNQKIKIFFKNIQITPYQNLKNKPLYKVEFFEEYYAPNFTFKGKKEIYLIKRENDFKIILEK